MDMKEVKHQAVLASGPPEVEEGHVGSCPFDPLAEKRLVRRLDWNILPLLMVIYLISFLDR